MGRSVWFLALALIAFGLFFANVMIGATSNGTAVFLENVGEMLVLLVACALFVIGILLREREAAPRN